MRDREQESRSPGEGPPEATRRPVQAGFRVSGLVQGVGFRWWACRAGRWLGLRGTVRNCRDGSVEIHAAGDAEALAEFEAQLRRGPPGAAVRSVERFDSTAALPEREFLIVR